MKRSVQKSHQAGAGAPPSSIAQGQNSTGKPPKKAQPPRSRDTRAPVTRETRYAASRSSSSLGKSHLKASTNASVPRKASADLSLRTRVSWEDRHTVKVRLRCEIGRELTLLQRLSREKVSDSMSIRPKTAPVRRAVIDHESSHDEEMTEDWSHGRKKCVACDVMWLRW